MRNVNLNILNFLESINNFCLSLANIGLEVSPDAKVGTAKHENILIDEFALFQLLFSSQCLS
ncbi:hypothetical protein [Microcystis aeruginosa]|uniref:hypothetical protein n=1 Tax=Microcystis aeruginosa TaxID=1126 RepID=UPI0008FFA47D